MFGLGKKEKKKKERDEKVHMLERDNKPTEADVILDIPEVKVDEINIKVRNLDAHVSVNAKLSNMVVIEAGADVHIGKVDIHIEGVRAEAYLKVRLERVKTILNSTIQVIDSNPDLLRALLKPIAEGVGKATGDIGEGAKETLSGVGETAKKLVSKAGDAVSNMKLSQGIKKMLKNVNIL